MGGPEEAEEIAEQAKAHDYSPRALRDLRRDLRSASPE